MDTLSFVYTGLLRNVKNLHYEIKDASTNEVYYEDDVEYETKSVYSSSYYQIVPAGASDYDKFSWDGTTKGGLKLKNNDKVIVTVSGCLTISTRPTTRNPPGPSPSPSTRKSRRPRTSRFPVRMANTMSA